MMKKPAIFWGWYIVAAGVALSAYNSGMGCNSRPLVNDNLQYLSKEKVNRIGVMEYWSDGVME